MLIVSDTSPIINLAVIEHLHLLRAKQAKMIDSVTLLMDRLRHEAVFYIHQTLYDFVKEQAGE